MIGFQPTCMHYHIELTSFEAVHTAVIRSRVPQKELSRFVPATCGEVWSFIRAAGLPKPGRHVAVYLDQQRTVEAGAEVAEPFMGNDRVQCSQLPVGRVATTAHFGPYSCLGEAHAAIRHWCASQGLALSAASWEIYGHWEESWNTDPSKIITEVFYLLQDTEN